MFSYRTNPPAGEIAKPEANNLEATTETTVGRFVTEQVIDRPVDFKVLSNGEVLLRISTVQQKLGVGKTTIWRLIEEERLERVKLFRCTLITLSSVDQLIAELVEEARRKRETGCE